MERPRFGLESRRLTERRFTATTLLGRQQELASGLRGPRQPAIERRQVCIEGLSKRDVPRVISGDLCTQLPDSLCERLVGKQCGS